jgi:tocopherol cyclase
MIQRMFILVSTCLVLIVTAGCSSEERNGYMLDPDLGVEYGVAENPMYTEGYDWWWHSLTAINRATGEEQPFFIEYYVINPGLGGDEPIFGQLPENQANGVYPSYAMIKAGTWVENASKQIHNFWGIDDFSASTYEMNVTIGPNTATETRIIGSVSLSETEAAAHPEYMSDAGEMSWDLTAEKILNYSVGYAASEVATVLDSFTMWWHVAGMKTLYSGTITYNGQVFDVIPEQSYGYQDKNWGSDYTNPWVWLNCNNFVDADTGETLEYTSLDVGGGKPEAFGIPLGKKVLVAFYYENELYEYNFSKLWEYSTQKFEVTETDTHLKWDIEAKDESSKLVISFSNPKSKMLKVNYENPKGEWNHKNLWNGGHAEGTVKLYKKIGLLYIPWKTFYGKNGGSEYGEY